MELWLNDFYLSVRHARNRYKLWTIREVYSYNFVSINLFQNEKSVEVFSCPSTEEFISIERNQVIRLDAQVFQSALKKINSLNYCPTSYLDLSTSKFSNLILSLNLILKLGNFIYYSAPIDCESDPCHLTWILVDNRHLLKTIYGARCLDGNLLDSINPETFSHCPKVLSILCW